MDGETLADVPPQSSTPPRRLNSLRQHPTQSSPSRKPSKISKTPLSIREAIRSQELEGRLSSSPPKRLITARRISPSANKIVRRQDSTKQEGSMLHKPNWSTKEFEIAPEGASAGRDGRKFTVANVGVNGKMYLRPAIRPANERYAQPQFTFPITPPSSAGLDALVARNEENQVDKWRADGALYTPTRSPSTPPRRSARDQYFENAKSATLPRAAHKRAYSYSTIADEQYSTLQNDDAGTFKIVIERPGSSRGRPRTATQLSGGIPTLEVPIPSYKLGTPRFSKRGTAFLRGSSYNGSYDERSSILTLKNTLHPIFPGSNSDGMVSTRQSQTSLSPGYLRRARISGEPPLPSPPVKHMSITISPGMYDSLTFKPACDDSSLVRYSGGHITAAVPARLISEITSPCFLDYDLLSDFFLTFRSYLASSDLLLMLVCRLQWALERNDEFGMIVRVRTFVAIRHWILNYFMDDFVVDYDMRALFCDLINTLVTEIKNGPNQRGNQLKIVEELKKCWRRTCALYWDGPDFGNDVPAEVPLRPGGIFGHRNPDLTPAAFDSLINGPPQLDDFLLEQETSSSNNFFADVQRAADLDSTFAQPPQPASAPDASREPEHDAPLSPESRMSFDAVSCSFPTKTMKAVVGSYPRPAAHPVPSPPDWDNAPPVATTPKALTGKRVRPANSHKRNGSFSDSMRDERSRQPVQTAIYKSTDFLMTLPLGGSLVRGNLFPPGKALVEVVAPSTPSEINRTTLSYPNGSTNQKGPSAMSGPGMRKLIGSVRRALGTRAGTTNPGASPTVGSFPKLPLLGTKGTTTNRLPGTAVVPQGHHQDSLNHAAVCALRIDLLGAGIAEEFKRAVQEDAEADSSGRTRASNTNTITSKDRENQTAHTHPPISPARPSHNRAPPSELTMGSKSILIVDDTVPFPNMSGALPIVSGSVDTFSDAYLQPSAGPTPPLTPPDQLQTTPRRSSEILGERRSQFRSLSLDRTPSLVQDVRSPSEIEQSPKLRPMGRPSVLSYGRSFKSKRSVSLRKYASFQSGFTRNTRQRSFDATTYTESRDDAFSQGVPSLPPPPHTLRRRPGGDLRAVANVGDLHPAPLRRHRSMGSISTYDDSERSSYMLGRDSADVVSMMSGHMSHPNTQTFSLGALADSSPTKREPSLCSTRSSKPPMRPSFEKEAAKLAQIPDDDFDDGGVESALLKLEGKYDQRHSDMSSTRDIAGDMPLPLSPRSFGVRSFDEDSEFAEDDSAEDEKRRHRVKHVDEVGLTKTPPLLETYQPEISSTRLSEVLQPAVYRPSGLEDSTRSFYTQESDPSYSSIPLLDRGLTDESMGRRNNYDWSHTSILREPSDERHDQMKLESSHPSYDFVDETESMKRIARGDQQVVARQELTSTQSFLTSDSDDDRSDLSSEMSLEVISNADGTAPTSPATAENAIPVRASGQSLLPGISGQSNPRSPLISENQLQQSYNQNPLTPIVTPTASTERNGSTNRQPGEIIQTISSQQASLHLPFILAFPSSLLAQQFTLIEKDALHEIDWKELIEMRWKSLPTPALSWVSFLRTASPRGVEVVIARFNIMVKWAVSEVVLTANVEERARCISKYIHIAAHCRRYKNFATLYQLTVAMTSNELSRLTKTWRLVPESDMKTLRELEVLVQPTRNFHALRVEMEESGIEDACIPFIGVYTQDLLWSAQKPSVIGEDNPSNGTGPLINFEKCRTQAGIVKSLLRLLEASSTYAWGPVEGLTERCLWMARLSDEEIRRRVDALEPRPRAN